MCDAPKEQSWWVLLSKFEACNLCNLPACARRRPTIWSSTTIALGATTWAASLAIVLRRQTSPDSLHTGRYVAFPDEWDLFEVPYASNIDIQIIVCVWVSAWRKRLTATRILRGTVNLSQTPYGQHP